MPGDAEAKLAKSARLGADVVVADLEDAVAPAAKDRARAAVAAWLAGTWPEGGPERWVRVDAGAGQIADLAAVVGPGLGGVVVPKCGSTADLARVGAELDRLEVARGLPPGSVRLAALVETARGVLAAPELAGAPRVARLHLGEADLCADLGMAPGPDGAELAAIRVQVVVASAAAGIEAPVGPVHVDLEDRPGLRRTSDALARLGFGGRSVVHPRQVEVVNAAFTPRGAAVARARALIERFEAHGEHHAGVFVDEDGRMVDEAVVRAARLVVARAGQRRT